MKVKMKMKVQMKVYMKVHHIKVQMKVQNGTCNGHGGPPFENRVFFRLKTTNSDLKLVLWWGKRFEKVL